MARRFGGALVVVLGLIAWSAAAEPGRVDFRSSDAASARPALGSGSATVQLAEGSAPELLESIAFAPRCVELNEAGQRSLETVAERLEQEPQSPLQIVAYAAENGATMDARRISLGRALAVRSFLVKQGVSSRRMTVKALGKPQGSEPAERVDILWPPR